MSFDSRRSGDRRSRLFDFLPACISSAFVENFPPMPPPRKIPARQRVLAQWRGVDLSPLETAKVVRARAAGDVVSRVLKDLHIDDRRAEAELVKVWNSLIDPNITAHAQPANLRKGTLVRERGQQRVALGNRPLPPQGNSGPLAAQLREKSDPENFLPRRVNSLGGRAALLRLSQKFFYVMGGAKAKVNPVGRTRLRTAAKANSFCHHRAS
jgi:hypothetical protein